MSGETLRLEPGIWRLTVDVPAGQWAQFRLEKDGERILRADTAQEVLLLAAGRTQLVCLMDPGNATGRAGVVLERMGGPGELAGAVIGQIRQWPRASLAAFGRQLSRGVVAVPRERRRWPVRAVQAAPAAPYTVRLSPGIELLPGAEGRIAELFLEPDVSVVTWDIAGALDGILPGPSPHLHRSLPYGWRASACRPGQEHRPLHTFAPGAWRHIHEPLARVAGEVPAMPAAPGAGRPAAVGRCSIILPTRDRPHLLRACLEGLARSQPAPDEIVLVDHLTVDADALALLDEAEAKGAVRIRADGPFNFSRLCNLGAAYASGDVLVFLNNDVSPLSAGWLEPLVSAACLPDAGAAGVELRYPDGRLQHVGMANSPELGPQHICAGLPGDQRGPLGVLGHQRECLAVTGACLATHRRVFDTLGGFDEAYPEDYNDVDYCLRGIEAGFVNLMVPQARLIHHETQTRTTGDAISEARRLNFLEDLRRRHPILAGPDPYFSPRLHSAPPLFRSPQWDR